jgi:hypothetical protein
VVAEIIHASGPSNLLMWIAKFIGGHQIVAVLFFGLLGILFHIPALQLLQPFLLVCIPALLFGMIIYQISSYRDRPKSFSFRLVAGFALYLSAFGAILLYFGLRFGLLPAGSSVVIIPCGLVGVGFVCVTLYCISSRRLARAGYTSIQR